MSKAFSEFTNDYLMCYYCFEKVDIDKFVSHHRTCTREAEVEKKEPKNLNKILNGLLLKENILEYIEDYNKEVKDLMNDNIPEIAITVIPVDTVVFKEPSPFPNSPSRFNENIDSNMMTARKDKNILSFGKRHVTPKTKKSSEFLKELTKSDLMENH